MKKVITFFGAESKVGTTMIAQSVAEELTARKEKCLMIFASSEMFDDYLKEDDSHVSLDDLLNLDPDDLKPQDIQRVITKANGLDYIKGSTRPLKVRYFSERLILKIIQLADYDYIVVDGGHNYQFPLPISSLLAATQTYYVLTQEARAVSRFQSTLSLILNAPALKTEAEKHVIVNKYAKNNGVYTPEMIRAAFEMETHVLPKVQGAEACEVNRITLSKTNRPYKAAITALTNVITGGGQNA